MKIKKHYLFTFLLILTIVSFFLRFYKLNLIPPGPEWDEASVGYNAYSIAQTGRDEWGNKLPLIFPAFGDYKNPLYIYLTAGVIKLFGLNIITTRFINALAGSLLPLILFFIAKILFNSNFIAILTAIFVTFSPLGIFFSRIAGDGIMLSSFLIVLGIFSELYFIKKMGSFYFYLSIIFFTLSMFSYNLARIVNPLFILVIFFINFFYLKVDKRSFILPIIICFFSFLIIYNQSKSGAFSRIKYVGMFGEKKGLVLEINEYREHDKNSLISRLSHNKLTFFSLTLLNNYISHFSSDFLVNFKEQTGVAESFYPPLYIIMVPFYYFGLILLIVNLLKNKQKPMEKIILFIWILLSPIPSMITEGAPSSKRYLASLGTQELISAYAIYFFYQNLKEKNFRIRTLIFGFLLLIYIFNIFSFLRFFYIFYPQKYGYIYAKRENKICKIIKNSYNNYDYFIYSRKIDGVPYIFPLFCLSYSPDKFWLTRKYRLQEGWFYIDSFDKFIFPDETNELTLNNPQLKGKKIALFTTFDEKEKLIPIFIKRKLLTKEELNKQLVPKINDKPIMLYYFSVKL